MSMKMTKADVKTALYALQACTCFRAAADEIEHMLDALEGLLHDSEKIVR